jgi:hypothetical protein
MVKRWVAVVAVVVISILLSTAPAYALQASPGPLERLLAQVPDSSLSRSLMWYGSLGDLERALGIQINSYDELAKLTQQQRAAYTQDAGTQVYYSPFSGAPNPVNWKDVFGIDPFAIDRELTVGQAAPNWYAILQGQFVPSAVDEALKGLGYTAAPSSNGTLYSLGNNNASSPNAQVSRLAASNYNRLLVTDKQIIAAPSDDLIKAATANGKMVGSDPAYTALVRAMEGSSSGGNTTLLSAALFGSDSDITGNSAAPLPQYQVAGLGYRRDTNNRFWVIALVYADANTANQAKTVLAGQLGTFTGKRGGRPLFQGWQTNVAVVPSEDNKSQVVIATMQLPQQTDVSLIDLVQNKDLGFLATR